MIYLKEEEEKALSVAVQTDLMLRIKEYARQGYEQTHSFSSGNFERLWRLAFQSTVRQSGKPAK